MRLTASSGASAHSRNVWSTERCRSTGAIGRAVLICPAPVVAVIMRNPTSIDRWHRRDKGDRWRCLVIPLPLLLRAHFGLFGRSATSPEDFRFDGKLVAL